jgi:hypothetical protein
MNSCIIQKNELVNRFESFSGTFICSGEIIKEEIILGYSRMKLEISRQEYTKKTIILEGKILESGSKDDIPNVKIFLGHKNEFGEIEITEIGNCTINGFFKIDLKNERNVFLVFCAPSYESLVLFKS